MHNEDRRSWSRVLLLPLTHKWAHAYELLAIVGLVLLGVSHVASAPWLKPIAGALIFPIVIWLVMMFVFAAPIMLVVQWFTRRSWR